MTWTLEPDVVDQLLRLKARSLRLLDEKDWERFAEQFAADASFEGFAVRARGGAAFATALAAHIGARSTWHAAGSPELEAGDDGSVEGRWTTHSVVMDDGPRHVYGRHRDRYVRSGSGWVIAAQHMTRLVD